MGLSIDVTLVRSEQNRTDKLTRNCSRLWNRGKEISLDVCVAALSKHQILDIQWHSNVIYKLVLPRKIRLTRRFSLFRLFNKWNKQVGGISSRLTGSYLVGSKRLLWSGLMVLLSDALSDGRLPYLYVPNFKQHLQKILFVEKNDWLKNRPFFIAENFLEILNRVCTEPMCRNHDFLAIVG